MAKKKEETTMLVRAVPLDVSERIRRYCRREGIKYREFVEKAIDQLEGANQEHAKDSGQEERTQKKVDLIERVAEINEKAKAYKMAIRLKKDLIKISEDVGFLAKWEDAPHIYLEVVGMLKELDDFLEKSIPKYDIPDDLEKRKAMGLPDLYCLHIVTAEEAEEIKGHNEEEYQRWKSSYEAEDAALRKKLKEKIEKLKQKFHGEDLMAGLKPDEDGAKPLTEKEQVNFGAAATAEPFPGPARHEPEPEPGKEQIKTTESGPEVCDGKKGSEGDE